MNTSEFLGRCAALGLYRDRTIARFVPATDEQVASWRAAPDQAVDDAAALALTMLEKEGISTSRPHRLDLPPMTKADFLDWCQKRGLSRPQLIARKFLVSEQTIRNWERDARQSSLALTDHWVVLAVAFYDAQLGTASSFDELDIQPPSSMTFNGLHRWQNKHRLKTYQDTADIFDIKRQAVHNWHVRGNLPRWLPLACKGFNILAQGKNKEQPSSAA